MSNNELDIRNKISAAYLDFKFVSSDAKQNKVVHTDEDKKAGIAPRNLSVILAERLSNLVGSDETRMNILDSIAQEHRSNQTAVRQDDLVSAR